MFPCKISRPAGSLFLMGLAATLLFGLLLAGCGGGESQSGGKAAVLATVGDTDITAEDYTTGLAKMEVKDLPVDDTGRPVDTSTLAGKNEFLDILINKELLRQKALQLGYDQDPQAVGARASLTAYHAGMALWEEVVGDPANTITEEELQAFYDKMGTSRNCLFVICNFIEDAEKARDMARDGADWDEVVAKYHDGSPAPNGKYNIKVPFGQYSTSFEDEVFNTPVGGVTNPIPTTYGFWVMRIVDEKQGDKPDLETAKAQILDVTRNRKMGRARNEFKEFMRKEHKLFIDEDVLWICYLGLPEGGLMDPETGQPRAKDTLEPLNVPLKDLDRIFYTYELDGELHEHTLGDYKGHFDNMSVFQRPKRSDMLGGLREHILNELERGFVNEEARKRGFDKDPEVVKQVDAKVEEVMVTKLYGDVVTFDDRVTPEQLDTFYNENIEDYQVPENREGRLVICLNEEAAQKARQIAIDGAPWRKVLKEFGIDRENKSRGGKLPGVLANGSGPVKDAIFKLQVGEVSEPILIENGRYGVVMLEKVNPSRTMEKTEMAAQIGQRIKNKRKEESFQSLLAQWSTEFGVTRHEENLADLPSWDDLQVREVPENLVPRN